MAIRLYKEKKDTEKDYLIKVVEDLGNQEIDINLIDQETNSKFLLFSIREDGIYRYTLPSGFKAIKIDEENQIALAH